jgi:hypothetical protein
MAASIASTVAPGARGGDASALVETYTTTTQMSWDLAYLDRVAKVNDLYTRAKDNQWNADRLDWSVPIDPAKPIIAPGHGMYGRMPWFQRLSPAQQETFMAHSTAQTLSQFLHGEQGAVLTAATITHAVPDAKAKFYAASQTMDEARHVEVYDRYVNKIAIHYPVTAWLKKLVDVTLSTGDYRKVMIGMNMIIEGLALGAFNNMYRQTEEPLLKSITFNVMRDESRHVSFGHAYLGPLVASLHHDDVEDLAQFAFDAVCILVRGQAGGIDPGFVRVLETTGVSVEDFGTGMKEAAELGITRSLPPGQIHSLKDLMMPAIARVGLITPRTRQLFVEAKIPVFEDRTVLEEMEDARSARNVLNEAGAAY